MKVGIIGAGLWGAAAARHLAKMGYDTTLIGPPEPDNFAGHNGPFASHYDEGRITRACATKPFWSKATMAAIGRYADIQRESGVSFFTPCGALMAGPMGSDFHQNTQQTAAELQITHDYLGRGGLHDLFPYFDFADDFAGFYEATNAGHISPRRLVAAQKKAAQNHGARVIREAVTGVSETAGTAQVQCGVHEYRFDKILVAAGGWSDHVLGRAPRLRVNARTVALFEIDEAQRSKLANMPSMVFVDKTNEAPYLLPPIQYGDGKIYIKLGGDPHDVPLHSQSDIADWFKSGGDAQVRDYLTDMIRRLMPDLQIQSIKMAPCVTTWTKDRLPEIRRISPHISVATAGNGAGAKCSDEMGRRGAQIAVDMDSRA